MSVAREELATGSLMPGGFDVAAAAARLRPHLRRTPLFDVVLDGRRMLLKLENLQVTGSFKARGAMNAVLAARPARAVAASTGNHGLGVANAARLVGARATVVVPRGTAATKLERLRESGAEVVEEGDRYDDAEAAARGLADRAGALFVHPFADPLVIAGQGTIGRELAQEAGDDCDAVLVAVGGGGLVAGVGLALDTSPMRVIGVEPERVPTLHTALREGGPVDIEVGATCAAALSVRRTTALNVAMAQRYAADVVLVGEAAIERACRLLWEHCRLVVEAAAAVGVAAVLERRVEADLPCVVICGGNGTLVAG